MAEQFLSRSFVVLLRKSNPQATTYKLQLYAALYVMKESDIVKVNRIDHLVLTVKDINETVQFYSSAMGMEKVEFGDGRIALTFGQQKINLHQIGKEFEPKARNVKSGSADLCFIIGTPVEQAINHLISKGIKVIEGPVQRTGALGKIKSAYFRDPDGNLLEVSNYANV